MELTGLRDLFRHQVGAALLWSRAGSAPSQWRRILPHSAEHAFFVGGSIEPDVGSGFVAGLYGLLQVQ